MAPVNFLNHARSIPTTGFSSGIYNLLVALLVLVSVSLVSGGLLLVIRHCRKHGKEGNNGLPKYPSHVPPVSQSGSRQRPLLFMGKSEKEMDAEIITRLPTTPLPEIRIQSPDEVDETGNREPGRVHVVKTGMNGVGLEPMEDDELPPYRPLRDPRVLLGESSEKQ